jgi:hypothetical protein
MPHRLARGLARPTPTSHGGPARRAGSCPPRARHARSAAAEGSTTGDTTGSSRQNPPAHAHSYAEVLALHVILLMCFGFGSPVMGVGMALMRFYRLFDWGRWARARGDIFGHTEHVRVHYLEWRGGRRSRTGLATPRGHGRRRHRAPAVRFCPSAPVFPAFPDTRIRLDGRAGGIVPVIGSEVGGSRLPLPQVHGRLGAE